MNKDQGFTLIELLVVIAIIAILTAILFPVFATAREKARQTACLNNMKQIGLGFLQYVQDYDEQAPAGTHAVEGIPGNGTGAGGSGEGWGGQLYPYVKSTAAFTCPDDNTKPGTYNGITLYPISYAYNLNLTAGFSANWPACNISKVANPSITVVMMEIHGDIGNVTDPLELTSPTGNDHSAAGDGPTHLDVTYFDYNAAMDASNPQVTYATGVGCTLNGSTPQSYLYYSTDGRHSDGSVYMMADGHAKWFKPTQVSMGTINSTSPTYTGGDSGSTGNCFTGDGRYLYAANSQGLGTHSVTYSPL